VKIRLFGDTFFYWADRQTDRQAGKQILRS